MERPIVGYVRSEAEKFRTLTCKIYTLSAVGAIVGASEVMAATYLSPAIRDLPVLETRSVLMGTAGALTIIVAQNLRERNFGSRILNVIYPKKTAN